MRRFVGVRALVAALLFALACFTISAAGAGAAPATGTRVVAPRPLIPHGARVLGPVSPRATVSGSIVLRPRDESALRRFISQVTDKHSPVFHRYLAPRQFAARFGATPASIAAVRAQLQAAGLAVTSIARDGLVVRFKAPASRVENAFRTGLTRYRLASGEIGRARTAPLRIPAAIAKYVTSVVGLDTTVRLHPSGILGPRTSAAGAHAAARASSFVHPAGSPTACAAAATAAQEFGGLTDDQIANAYGAFGLYGAGDTGSGQHIAVFELEPFAQSDLRTFDTCYFGSTAATQMLSRLHVKPVDGGQTAGPGGGEAILDIQDVSAFAPGASLDVYEAPNTTFGSFDEYLRIVNDNVDKVVTTSWGLCEQAVEQGSPGIQQAENLVFEQAAAQGQTVFSAAGDQGSNDCNAFRTTAPVSPVLSVDDPSSQPYVVSTGGTTMDDATQPAAEHVWNDGAVWGAGGGGISEAWPTPTWQLDSHVPGANNATVVSQAKAFEAADLGSPGYAFCASDNPFGSSESGCREVPDVSAEADEFTGAVTIYVAEFGGWLTIGGTSSAAPMWAGMLADVNASSTCKNNPKTASGVGFVNPLLYSVASNPTAYAASFNDIKTGNNDPYGDSNLFQATTGYDMASGLGTPQLTQPGGGAGLAFYLCSQAPAATRPTVTSLTPTFASTSDPGPSVQITGTNFKTGSTVNVADVQVGSVQIPTSDVHVVDANHMTVTFPAASSTIPPHDQTDGAGRVQVTVTLLDGQTSAATASSWFTYVDENGSSQPLPTVAGIHTYAGPDAGGNTVDILGAGFANASSVTFGGRPGTIVSNLHNGTDLRVTVPAFQNGVTVCDQDGSTFDAGNNGTNDICQTQVVVTTPNGSSATATILPLYEGAISFADDGVLPAPPGQEAGPATTEYDYVPKPTISSISTSPADAASLASEEGGSVVTILGKGFNLAALEWVNFGDPTQAASQQFFNLVSVTGTKIEIDAPSLDANTVNPKAVSVSVQSAGGLSNLVNATYAGVPTVSGVLATSGPTAGTPAGPATGGTPIDLQGNGFANQVLAVTFNDIASPFSFGTQYDFTAIGNTDLTSKTVSQNPAVVDTQVCTVTDCSTPTFTANGDTADVFFLFPPGAPKIDSITPASGPATGGTNVTITGQNLGCVFDISFGSVHAPPESFTNSEALLDCGATNTVIVTTPPHAIGAVKVTLSTLESVATGGPSATGSFTYTKPLPEKLTVHKAGTGSGKVTSSPAGINCGATCSHQFPQNTSVTLKVVASRGSTFTGWSGACTGKATCKVTVRAATSVTAKFTGKPCVVPNVKGKTLRSAKRTLKAHVCSVGKIRQVFSSTVKTGRVISQKPKAGSRIKHNGKVNLTLSKGKKH